MLKYVVLDLDECLVTSYKGDMIYNICMNQPQYITVRHRVHRITFDGDVYSCLSRPHLRDFLIFLQSRYKVVVWSAGDFRYVHAITKHIFHGLPEPDLILTRNDVTNIAPKVYHKPLTTLFQHRPDANMSNSVIIDNMENNFRGNPANGIHVPNFEPTVHSIHAAGADTILLSAAKWLEDNDHEAPEFISPETKHIEHDDDYQVNIEYPFARYPVIVSASS
jgi:hypothetical protein